MVGTTEEDIMVDEDIVGVGTIVADEEEAEGFVITLTTIDHVAPQDIINTIRAAAAGVVIDLEQVLATTIKIRTR